MRTYTTEEAAYLLGVSNHTILSWIRNGQLKATRCVGELGYGYYYQINENDLEESIANHAQHTFDMIELYGRRRDRQRKLDYLDARENELYDELCIIQEMKRQISRWDL